MLGPAGRKRLKVFLGQSAQPFHNALVCLAILESVEGFGSLSIVG